MRRALAICLILSTMASPVVAPCVNALACGSESYSATGVIKDIGSDHRSVRIAHGVIGGFSTPRTTSFEVASASLLKGLAVGDHIRFAFTATDDGRRVVDRIGKDPKVVMRGGRGALDRPAETARSRLRQQAASPLSSG